MFTYLNAVSLDELIKDKDVKAIKNFLKSIKVVYDENDFPNNPKNYDLAIIEDDYNVQLVYEYINGVWNERTDKVLAHILNSKEKLGFSHLFGFKSDNNQFETESLDKTKIFVEILISKANKIALSKSINNFILLNKIKQKNIINIQIQILNSINSKIIIIYKN